MLFECARRRRTENGRARRFCWKGRFFVHRNERIALTGQAIQERAVVEVGCAKESSDSRDVMAREEPRQAGWHACVQHNAHSLILRGARRCLPDERLPREFEDRDRVFTRHVRKIREELRELMAAFDVVDKRAHGHARPGEARFTSQTRGTRRD